ncbi:Hypothetical_protein [Hexamita inflata]|uniref:Hypothetical_protein n=1 Tax=Hexamita inflata TaxID=28002 RepID=A0ABP1GIB9_9EUKA
MLYQPSYSVDQLPLQNSQNSYFMNFMLYNLWHKKKNSNKVSPGGVAGIATLHVLLSSHQFQPLLLFSWKKKQLNTAIATESTGSHSSRIDNCPKHRSPKWITTQYFCLTYNQ